MPAQYAYNANPTSRTGQGVYGRVPGSISLPQPARDLQNQLPNLSRINHSISNDIYAGANGQLAPGTLADLQDFNASWASQNGLPSNSGIARNRMGRNIGLASQALIDRAIGQYNSFVPTVSGTQTVNPGLQTQIAEQNSLNDAAPDPTQAGSHAERLFREYQNRIGGGAIGGGGVSRGGGGGLPWYEQPNPTAGPAAADSMGMIVARGPQGGTQIGTPGIPRFYGNPATGSGNFYAGDSYEGLTPAELWESDFWGEGSGLGGTMQGADQGTGE